MDKDHWRLPAERPDRRLAIGSKRHQATRWLSVVTNVLTLRWRVLACLVTALSRARVISAISPNVFWWSVELSGQRPCLQSRQSLAHSRRPRAWPALSPMKAVARLHQRLETRDPDGQLPVLTTSRRLASKKQRSAQERNVMNLIRGNVAALLAVSALAVGGLTLSSLGAAHGTDAAAHSAPNATLIEAGASNSGPDATLIEA